MHNCHLVVGNAIDARTALQRRPTRARAAFGPESMASMRAGGAGLAGAGYQLGDAIELRAVYFDAGRFKGGGTTPAGLEFGGDFKVNGFGITAGCRWALAPQWSLAAHAGVASVRTRFDHANPIWGEASQTTTQPLVGVGLAYAINPAVRLGIDYDATRFQAHTTRGPLHMLGLSA